MTERVPRPQDLVSLGVEKRYAEQKIPGQNDTETRELEYELLCDWKHGQKMYVRWRHDPNRIEPIDRHSGDTEKVVKLGTVRRRNGATSGRHAPGEDEKRTRIERPDW